MRLTRPIQHRVFLLLAILSLALCVGIVRAEAIAGAITDVRLHSTATTSQANLPVTFGQVFAPGALKPRELLTARLAGGGMLPVQLDVKATHADGSVRHAIVSLLLPSLAAGKTEKILLVRTAATSTVTGSAPTAAQVLASGFKAELVLRIDGKVWRASADRALAVSSSSSSSSKPAVWLSGPLTNEWLLAVPLKTADGSVHPHLQARFALRAVGNPVRVRVDVTVENNWAYEPGPKNLLYDADLLVNGKSAYAKTGLLHYHQARWRKIVWSGSAPQVDVLHNSAYLIASRAVPNYDQRVVIAEQTLAEWKTGWTGPKTEPMAIGLATHYMPMTGGRLDIGILPGWAAAYVLSMDPRAKEVTLGTGDLAGSWSMHYRDRATGRPVSLVDYPYMSLIGRADAAFNPISKKDEAFPACAGDCKSPYEEDAAHQPSLAYLPYLVTGDYYYLEELQFWTMLNLFRTNPGYREAAKGLVKPEQVRGQAWDLRTLAQAAYITPDADPLKAQFRQFLDNNLAWYDATYTNNPEANALGIIVVGSSVDGDQGTIMAPWQDDFFTQVIGYTAGLGFRQADALLAWKSRFAIGRMANPDFCWVFGAAYYLNVRPTPKAPLYAGFGDVYRANAPAGVAATKCGSPEMAALLKLKPGEMQGYADSATGFPANMQPALAYVAEIGGAAGAKAWKVFDARAAKPHYASQPQFAIVPR